ncbi:SLAM family member 9 [Xenopus laevis]|uniref:SLAM family member 9 n=1 Tax=Xenopus laevis TaxID=8355 RepID=A0A8J0TLM9_XENLA|nr:SLAM family member 9 [Xenopus laevis]XP_041429523.1 SLAM family member 9 [Xenopus laevis]
MEVYFYWTLMLLYLPKTMLYAQPCGPTINVSITEGGEASLHVNETDIIKVSWDVSNGTYENFFAKKQPGTSMNAIVDKYRGRVRENGNSSLLVSNLSLQDWGTYTAHVFSNTGVCQQSYDVRVYRSLSDENIEIEYNITSRESCNMTVTCRVEGPDTKLAWSSTAIGRAGVGEQVLYVYNAEPDLIYSCTAENPVSRAARSLTPWAHCLQDKSEKNYIVQNIIRFILSAFILICGSCVFARHLKREGARNG